MSGQRAAVDRPGIVLQPLGDPDAAVCIDGVCELPAPAPAVD